VSAGKLIAAGLLGLAALGGAAVYSVPSVSKPIKGLFTTARIDIVTYPVRKASLVQTVVERGNLESSKNEDVYCNVEGQVVIISIKSEGSPVKKGEVVCTLDSAALQDSLVNQKITTKSAEANLENAKLTREVAEIAVIEYEQGIYVQDLATAEGEIKLALSDLTRAEDRLDWARRMYVKGYVSKAMWMSEDQALKKARFALEQAETKKKVLEQYTKHKTIKELKSEVEKAHSDELAKKATYELETSKERKLEKQIAYCELKAPNDGLVVYANDPTRSFGSNQPQIEEGATVRERQKIFSLPDINRMQVNTKVHESQIDKITPNMKAKIRVDSFGDKELNGTVIDVAPLPDPTTFFSSDIKVYTAHVRIDDLLPGLRPGMSAEVTILVDRRDDVLTVPVNSILQYGGKNHVTKKRDERFERVEVELGPSNEKHVQVLKGLQEGDVVVLNPGGLLSEEEQRELFGSTSKLAKKEWDGTGEPPQGKEGAAGPGADGKAIASGVGKGGAGKGKAGAKKKGGFQMPPEIQKIMAKLGPDRARMKGASQEEREEILKKAGLTPEEMAQLQQFQEQMRARFQGGGGGGFGGGGRFRGGPPGGDGGPGGGQP
jgi:HlyD family secretion protein